MEKYLKDLIARLIGNFYNETPYYCEIKEVDGFIKFEVKTLCPSRGFNKYKGYLGVAGSLCVTEINGEYLGDGSNYIEIT